MGQQQLLLLVLGIVIVGIAVVAGIQAFSEGKGKAQQDAAVSDAMRVISDVQAWMMKPLAFGGGEGATVAPTFKALGYPAGRLMNTNKQYKTVNGSYEIGGTATQPTVKAYQDTTCTAANEIATVTIKGTGTKDIAWVYKNS